MTTEVLEVETARRVRAALAYADIDVTRSQEEIGISSATMARIVSPTRPRGVKRREELELIADGCKIPLGFLLHGFEPEEPSITEKVEALERKVEVLMRHLSERATEAPEQEALTRDLEAIADEMAPMSPASVDPTGRPADDTSQRPAGRHASVARGGEPS